jgi:hypothetical protein
MQRFRKFISDSKKALELTSWKNRPNIGFTTNNENDVIMEIHDERKLLRTTIAAI